MESAQGIKLTNSYNRSKIHPHKFALYVSMASIMMMFAGLTSAFVVRRAAGNWLEFYMPREFYISAAVIVASSICLHLSVRSFKRGSAAGYKLFMILAMICGIAFVGLQYSGWLTLDAGGIAVDGNPSGSFVYAISGLHVAHVVGGIAVLLVCVLRAFTVPYKRTERRLIRLELSAIYWHFVDILWLYLLFFMIWQM